MYSFFFFSSRRRHTRLQGDWSSDVCSSDLRPLRVTAPLAPAAREQPCRRQPRNAHGQQVGQRAHAAAALVHHTGRIAACQQLVELRAQQGGRLERSEEHTSELQSPCNLVCRLLLEKKKHTT